MYTIFKLYYDENQKKINYKAFEVEEKKNIAESNIDECKSYFFDDEKFAANAADSTNTRIVNGELHMFKCKDCGAYYLLESGNIEWYKNNNLAVPKRCYSCIRERKNK